MSNQQTDLVFLIAENSPPRKLIEYLNKKNFSTRTCLSVTQAYEEIKSLACPILIIYDEGQNKACEDLVLELSQEERLFTFPLVISTKLAEQHNSLLERDFELTATINQPCPISGFVSAIIEISSNLERMAAESSIIASEEAPRSNEIFQGYSVQNNQLGQDNQENLKKPKLTNIVSLDDDELPVDVLFKKLKINEYENFTLTGEIYAALFNPPSIKFDNLIKADQKLLDLSTNVLNSVGKWGKAHLMRVCYLTLELCKILKIDDAQRDATIISAVLFAQGFNGKHKPLLKRDYTGTGNSALKKSVCSIIKDSALKISCDYNSANVGSIIAGMARLVGKEETPDNTPESISSSILMISEQTDRFCWNSGRWNPRQAYSMARRLKTQEWKSFNPTLVNALSKLLTEAVTCKLSTYMLLPKKIKNQKEFFEKVQKSNIEINENEIKVSISKLTPEMRISKPLYAYDGREILPRDLILDRDLIDRIWQLSYICPLLTPTVYKNSIKRTKKNASNSASNHHT